MSAFMQDVARASLPVAIALLIAAACARGVLWAQIDDASAQRIAGKYLEPLSTWCLVTLATHVFALGAAGDAGLFSVAVAIAVGIAAVLLRAKRDTDQPRAAKPEVQPTAADATPAARAPSSAGRLWAESVNDASIREGQLWTR
jgi:hypothetical protein